MSGLQQAKSEETRRKVLEAACEAIESGGLAAVNIRNIAKEAGYSIGSVYKHFKDVDELIIAVNTLTFSKMKDRMAEAFDAEDDPLNRLQALARTYYRFSRENTKLWLTLFGHRLPEDYPTPEEHVQANVDLLSFVGQALQGLHPELEGEELTVRVKTCFAAVHGIVALSYERRFVSLSDEVLERELEFAVARLVA